MDKTVLCYIKYKDRYLLMLRNKKKDDINKTKWIGVGGHIEEGESKEEALIREVKEETGLTLLDYTYRGEILFTNDDFEEVMYLFIGNRFEGKLIDCDEGELHWVDKKDILSLNLWEGDRLFLPKLINDDVIISMELVYSKDRLIKVIDRGN